MEDIYVVNIGEQLFDKILNNNCSYYVFLNDRKALQYKIGNILSFQNQARTLKIEIINMLYFSSIKELLDMVGKDKLGYTPSQNPDKIEDIYYVNYKAQDIENFGLVAVEFKII